MTAATATSRIGFLDRLHDPSRPVLVFDGATGTSLQQMNLSAEDFGGPALEGCNENLVFTRPDAVQAVHRQFLEVGADVIETDTFGAASIVLAEYGLEDQAFALNKRAAELAREVAEQFSTAEKPRFVAGSIGPTTKLPTLGHIDFDTMKASFCEQAAGLLAGDVDLFIVETCQDVLQIKAALQGIEEAFREAGERRPLMVSVTMETTGTMLVGSDIAAVVAILEPFPIDVLGLNCATGPEQMKEHVRYLSEHCPFVVSCIPNAGLPENIGGVAHYRLTPTEMKMQLLHFVEDLGVQVIGGCCGTTPAHIGALAELAAELHAAPRPVRRSHRAAHTSAEQDPASHDHAPTPDAAAVRPALGYEPAAASLYGVTPYLQDNSFLIIGERLNASGSKKVRELLAEEDWDGLVAVGRSQVKENAHVLDVNVDYVGRDGERDMRDLVSRLVTNVNLPLMLDSTEWQKMRPASRWPAASASSIPPTTKTATSAFSRCSNSPEITAPVWWWAPSMRRAWPARPSASSPSPSGPTATPWNSAFQPTRSSTTPSPCPSPPASRKTASTVRPRWRRFSASARIYPVCTWCWVSAM